ncbi:MAG: hypothetical protein ACOCWG_03050 [bacterium]
MENREYRKMLKRMGYLDDQQGIISRYIEEEGEWNNHLARCKEFILASANKRGKENVFILGSGWLLDVPLDELSGMFKTVYLVDVEHPVQVKKKISDYQNVQLLNMDITGGYIEKVYHAVRNKNYLAIKDIHVNGFQFPGQPSFVVSINIMNQLDIILVDYIKKFKFFDENDLLDFRKRIQMAHLNSLPVGKSCLITDFEEIHLSKNKDEEIGKKKLIFTELPDAPKQEWIWNFDTRCSYYSRDFKTFFKVVALEF